MPRVSAFLIIWSITSDKVAASPVRLFSWWSVPAQGRGQPYKLVHFADVDNLVSLGSVHPVDMRARCRRVASAAAQPVSRKEISRLRWSQSVLTRKTQRVDSSSVLFTPMAKLQSIVSNTIGKRFGRDEDEARFHRGIPAAHLSWWSIDCSKLCSGTRSVQDHFEKHVQRNLEESSRFVLRDGLCHELVFGLVVGVQHTIP